MFDLEVDYEGARELLIEMAEEFDNLGFTKVLEDFEGSGRIGKAVANPRDAQAVKIITLYMKGIAKELLVEEADLMRKVQQAPYLKDNPQFKQSCQIVLQAKRCLEETFQELKKCFKEPELAKPLPQQGRPAMMPAQGRPARMPAQGRPAMMPAQGRPAMIPATHGRAAPRMLPPAAARGPAQRMR